EATASARQLADLLGKETDPDRRFELAVALGAVADRMEPAKAAPLCAQAARLLTDALTKEKKTSAQSQLAKAPEAVAARLEPADAARLVRLAKALEAVAARLESADAARLVRQLADALVKEKDPKARPQLIVALRVLTTKNKPAEISPRILIAAHAAQCISS